MYTLQEKIRYTRHVHLPPYSTYATCMWQPFASHHQCWTDPTALEKRGSRHNPNSTEWSIGLPPSFSPNTFIEAVMKAKHLLMNKLHQFIGPITPICDWYVQYLLVEANSSVLNRHRHGLQPWRCRLSTYHSSTFPTDGLHFPPKSPTWSPV
jgi:hypothetical protein